MDNFSKQHQKSRLQFNRQAHFYADSAHFSKGKTLGIMDGYIREVQPQTVLDVATGAGFMALAAAQVARTVIGTDIAEELLALAVKAASTAALTNVHFMVGSAEMMPIQNHQMDLVTCRIAAHHFANIELFLAECHRVTRPGGALAFTDTISDEDPIAAHFLNAAEMLRDPSHVKCQSPTWWQQAIESAGFRIRQQTVSSNAEMSLTGWAERGGVTTDTHHALVKMFHAAPDSALRQYKIRKEGNDYFFHWPTFSCLAVKSK